MGNAGRVLVLFAIRSRPTFSLGSLGSLVLPRWMGAWVGGWAGIGGSTPRPDGGPGLSNLGSVYLLTWQVGTV